jgi:hypothetical protein
MRTTVCSVKASGRSVMVSVLAVSENGTFLPSTVAFSVSSSSPSRTSGWTGTAGLRRMASVAVTTVPAAVMLKSRSTLSTRKAGGV